jgi:hypothetical protein
MSIQRLLNIIPQAHAFEIPAQTQECTTYPTARSYNTFRYEVSRDADVMKPIAAFIRTSYPPPPLDRLLEDMGSLQLMGGGQEIVNIPIKLLVAATGVDLTYEGRDLIVPLELDMFLPAIPMVRLSFHAFTISLNALSSTVEEVRFMMQKEFYDTDVRRELVAQQSLTYPIQYLKTQTMVAPAHTNIYTFQLQTATLMKGFFVEGSIQDISGVEVRLEDGSQVLMYSQRELRMVGQRRRGDSVFVPFRRDSAYTDPRTESYVGGFYDNNPISIKITYHFPRYSSSIHGLFANKLRFSSGMCGLQFSYASIQQPHTLWTTATRVLNPERNTCPITYEAIVGDFCECDQCHHAFDATAFQNYATNRNPVPCPTCRTPWTTFTVYQQSGS